MFVNFSIFWFCFSWLIIIVEVVNLYAFAWDNLDFQKPKRSQQKLWFDSSLAIQRKSNILQIYAPPTFPVLASFIDCCYYKFFFWLPRPTHALSSTNTQSLGVTSCSPNPLFFPFKQLNANKSILSFF